MVHRPQGDCGSLSYVFLDDSGQVTSGITSVSKLSDGAPSSGQAGTAQLSAAEDGWTQAQRIDVQDGLLWAGHYSGLLDGDFGAGTRRAIRAFQADLGASRTGTLTATQIDLLRRKKRQTQADAGFRVVTDDRTGIRIGMPEKIIAYQGEEDGLHIYRGKSGQPWSELALVDVPGSRATLAALYGSLVGPDDAGPDRYAVLKDDWFVVSYTKNGTARYSNVRMVGGSMKGFILRWTDEESSLFPRIAAAMFNSFEAVPQVTPSAAQGSSVASGKAGSGKAGDGREARAPIAEGKAGDGRTSSPYRETTPQQPDLRRQDLGREPDSTGTGFVVDRRGRILTNAHVIDGCQQITLANGVPARVIKVNDAIDLALIEAEGGTWPRIAAFAPKDVRLNSDVTVIGYPLHGLLGGVNVTRGSVSALSGLRDNQSQIQITAAVQPGNSGGPVLDNSGSVLGVVQSKLDAVKLAEEIGDIPQNINFAIRGDVAKEFLFGAGIRFQVASPSTALSPADLADAATQFTVLVSCYE
ncbi:MAG: serine protease [Pseudomonadota bacterium]